MLKIKDSVDLKELEKFGFKYRGNYNRGDCWEREDNNPGDGIIIQGEWANYKISYLHPYKKIEYPPIQNYIQDLIKADMVEKVEE